MSCICSTVDFIEGINMFTWVHSVPTHITSYLMNILKMIFINAHAYMCIEEEKIHLIFKHNILTINSPMWMPLDVVWIHHVCLHANTLCRLLTPISYVVTLNAGMLCITLLNVAIILSKWKPCHLDRSGCVLQHGNQSLCCWILFQAVQVPPSHTSVSLIPRP